jgi:hypothetical protein
MENKNLPVKRGSGKGESEVPPQQETFVTKNTKEFLKYEFTDIEVRDKGMDLARLQSEYYKIEGEAKAVASEFKAKKDGKAAEIEILAGHVNNGYEHRYIDCEVRYNCPNTGIKSTYRKDTGEFVRKESMSAEEMQLSFDLEMGK